MDFKDFTLLYVEDDPTITALMQELLEDDFKQLYIAHDGEEGLALYHEHHPDIIISDIYMPKMDGLEMSQAIKSINPEQPIILLTAFSNVDDLKRAIDIGINHYVNKPIQSHEQIQKPLADITEKLTQKQQLEALREQLSHLGKYAAIGELIAFIAHQWRQPLSIIATDMTTLQLRHDVGTLTEEDMLQSISKSQQQIQYLSETIDDFRNFLRPKEHHVNFSIKDQIKKVVSLLQSTLNRDEITLVLPENDLLIQGQPNHLSHVLLNIINNAREAFIETNTDKRLILIELVVEASSCLLTISDSGGGIPKDVISHIFEPYFTTKDASIGTGLGLYMAKEFVFAHLGGKLDVRNRDFTYEDVPYHGASFTISLPYSPEAVKY